MRKNLTLCVLLLMTALWSGCSSGSSPSSTSDDGSSRNSNTSSTAPAAKPSPSNEATGIKPPTKNENK